MADKHEEAVRKKALAAEFFRKSRANLETQKARFSEPQKSFLWPNGKQDQTILHALEEAMGDPKTVPSEYIARHMGWLFDGAIPKRDKAMILYFADILREYPYSDSYGRRSFRAKENAAYFNKIKRLIWDHVLPALDAPIGAILDGKLPEDAEAYFDQNPWLESYTEWQLAYALDMGDRTVEDAVRRIVTEENGTGRMTRALIRGVLFSHRIDFHELLGKLLLAAKLQEGLRQTICENADCGTKSGFLTILRVIEENNLIRFSSVKRAVGTWLGLLSEESRDLERVSNKSVNLIIDCLTDDAVREEYLASEDAMKIYIALWSYGFDDIDTAAEKIVRISESGSRHQLLVAGYFAANMDLPSVAHKLAKHVLNRHHDKEDVLAVWLPSFMPHFVSALWDSVRYDQTVEFKKWFESPSELDACYRLTKKIRADFSGKTKTFSPCVFPWHEAKLEKSLLSGMLCSLAALSGEEEKIDEACAFIKECDLYQRKYYLLALTRDPKTPVQRRTALEGLVDKETYCRSTASEIVAKMTLTPAEYGMIEEYLRFKGADIRKSVMDTLLKQDDEALTACISRLLASKKEDVRLGGLDMLCGLKKDEKRAPITDSFAAVLSESARAENVTAKEKILLDTLVPKGSETVTEAEEKTLFTEKDKYQPLEFDGEYIELCSKTFAEYFPDSALPDMILGKKQGLFGKLKAAVKESVACRSAVIAAKDLLSLSGLIEEHRNDSFEQSPGCTELLGNCRLDRQLTDKDGNLPFMPLWKSWIEANAVTHGRLVRALVLLRAYRQKWKFAEASEDLIRAVFGTGFEYGKELPYGEILGKILRRLLRAVPSEELRRLGAAIAVWFLRCVPDDRVMLHSPSGHNLPVCYEMVHLLAHDQLHFLYQFLICENDGELKYSFPLAVAVSERCVEAYRKIPKEELPKNDHRRWMRTDPRMLIAPHEVYYSHNYPLIGVNAYLLAAHRNIISETQLCEFLLREENICDTLQVVTAVAASQREKDRQIASRSTHAEIRNARAIRDFLGKEGEPSEKEMELIRFVDRVYDVIIPTVLDSELKRGDSPTPYSSGIPRIARVYGANVFARILSSMGSDTIERIGYWGWGETVSRKASLSHLLSVCIPSSEDSADTLRAALAGKKIAKKRLIEAALFSAEWIPFVGEYLGIESFESVCYYFMAHMNEKFDDKRKAIIAKFTPLSDDELNLGAFDVNWFRSAHGSIGEKEFDLIYDAAKYISDGAKHARARKYADASLGKFDVTETEKTVSDKRNKDLLMAYALIPLTGEDDICRRYLYLQRFRKESKQFGSQRIASENKAVEMAMTNLAINAGYSDTMRLTLRMETKVIDDSRALLEEQTVEGVTLKIVLDPNGKAELTAAKDGKPLKSIPAKIKKHETVLALTELKKTLTEQYRRTRVMLERAMEDRTAFTFAELSALSAHPVVYPMLKNLVLVSGDATGFLADGGLADDGGAVQPLTDSAEVRIAHPFDLYAKGCWRNYQKHLFANKIAQPFRQVFRELYIKTAEEMGMLHSLRYAGNQIQPAKTVGALKSRRWVADVEDGLQKVYYKENIIAQIYALADWFSPADIEAPTLEWVCFTDRKTGEEMKIADIPDIVFSEVMRDVDLAVSVAHAGGVDPETSHSTMEMRAAILSFVLPMFRIGNVKLEGHHAIIDGKLAEYSVHLGSGVVHQIGGAMIPVLPVHSQHKGKIFLPFVDDDPKTAEVISKVLLFAEDGKIKDPMIISAIQR